MIFKNTHCVFTHGVCNLCFLDGYLIPKGATIACVLQMVLNDSKCWERPKDFYPDHFLPENVEKRPKGAFLPFATGPRMCPGKYTMSYMKQTAVN